MFPSVTYALDALFEGRTTLALNETKTLLPFSISQASAGEIKEQYGINLILKSDVRALWDANSGALTIEGTAVTNGKIDSSVTPTFSSDYKALNISVKQDFAIGEKIVINNLNIRAYDRYVSINTVGVDLNGDLIPESYVDNVYEVLDTLQRTDVTAPYPPTDLQYTYNETVGTLHLTWVQPSDYDLIASKIDKKLVRGSSTIESVITPDTREEYTDIGIQPNDTITYNIYSMDRRNEGEKLELTIEIDSNGQLITSGQTEEPAEEPVDTELTQLGNLYGYYKIRYSINCMRNGIPATINDSACLWARIDLVYTQEKLSKSDISTSITAYDITLLSGRMKYPEQRYQTNCVDAETAANYCSALKKAIDRANYFIEK